MNVYDFDKTIYNGDSTLDFYFFCLIKQPTLIRFFPFQFFSLLRYLTKKNDKKTFKQDFYVFLKGISNIDILIEQFWDIRIKNIKSWYLKKQKSNDLVISASPQFLLETACLRLGITNLIASEVDKFTGVYCGENCYGSEKLLRYNTVFPEMEVLEFYSDSISDSDMAAISKNAYFVKGDNCEPWPESRKIGP